MARSRACARRGSPTRPPTSRTTQAPWHCPSFSSRLLWRRWRRRQWCPPSLCGRWDGGLGGWRGGGSGCAPVHARLSDTPRGRSRLTQRGASPLPLQSARGRDKALGRLYTLLAAAQLGARAGGSPGTRGRSKHVPTPTQATGARAVRWRCADKPLPPPLRPCRVLFPVHPPAPGRGRGGLARVGVFAHGARGRR